MNSTLQAVKKTILIAPFEGPLAAALAQEARLQGWSVAVARTESSTTKTPAETKVPAPAPAEAAAASSPALIPLPWNPSSYVSTSALFLAAKNALGDFDVVILLAQTKALRTDLVGGKPGEVESSLHQAAIGPALLVRETLRGFEARRSGTLVFVDREAEARGPAEGLVSGAFSGLAEGVFAVSREASWEAFGILDKAEVPEDTVRFIFKLLEEKKSGKTGRWLKFTGKTGPFGIF